MFQKLKLFLKDKWLEISFTIASVLLVVLVSLFIGCQGLANINGSDNQMILTKEACDVSQS